jgi:hypothetical protein
VLSKALATDSIVVAVFWCVVISCFSVFSALDFSAQGSEKSASRDFQPRASGAKRVKFLRTEVYRILFSNYLIMIKYERSILVTLTSNQIECVERIYDT